MACPSLEDPHAKDESLLDVHFQKCREISEKAIMLDQRDAKGWMLRAKILEIEDEKIQKQIDNEERAGV